MTVWLATLDGNLDFTELQSWRANAAPGAAGTGRRWRDGTLNYGTEVYGSAFYATSGDEGLVNGTFFGSRHDAMGGTLRREGPCGGVRRPSLAG